MDRRRARSDLDKAERRADILEAARATIDGSEMDEFTMDAVAAKLGLAKGTLYRYFPSKEFLLVSVMLSDIEGLADRLAVRPPEGEDPVGGSSPL